VRGTDTALVVSNDFLRREVENRLVEASFEVAPDLDDMERVSFVQCMMSTLSADDAAAILGH
jgi:hypothetical protein